MLPERSRLATLAAMDHEVIVIGGGAAGLSAALVLGRARRQVLVLDDGAPSNAPAHAVGGLLGQRETSPLELLEQGREQLADLPTVQLRRATATDVRATADGVAVDGARARKLLLATGMRYAYPALPGVEELWGDTVFHCPFCHGWEVAGLPLAVLNDAHGVPLARMLRAWSDDVVLLADPEGLADADRAALDAAGVTVDGRTPAGVRARDGRLEAILFADGSELRRGGLLIEAPLQDRSSLFDDLGLARTPHGAVAVDEWGRTSAAHVWAAGDAAVQPPSITAAIASGARAGAGLVQDLMLA
jgi:thioredoxin reductase